MQKIKYNSTYFNIKDTLECGQIFRFLPYKNGYMVFSKDKCCYAYQENDNAIIECEDSDKDYFYNYFDLNRDYEKIVNDAKSVNNATLKKSAELGKGVRILNQEKTEMLFSFIISQNNNIPRIKGIIERLCAQLGEKKTFNGEEYFAFPTIEQMAKESTEFYSKIGLGYRAEYIRQLAVKIQEGFDIENLNNYDTETLKKELLKIYGVGPKVADCVSLFGFHRADSFPVDVWMEKVYREDFFGIETDRKKITSYFMNMFNDNAGYFQQYLFYYKRSLEKNL